MKTIRLTCLFAALFGLTLAVNAAERTSIQGILIAASKEAGETDRRLAPYEPTLRKILSFASYRHLGEDSTSLNIPASGSLSIGDGHQLEVSTESNDGKSIHVKVRWTAGGRTLMNTGLTLRPGVPAVLGGPSTGNKGEVYAVILIGK